MDREEIEKYLPHRDPFLFVDQVIEFEQHKRIVAIKNVSIDEPFFAGHFPVQPIFPGVLIIEALAQAAGILAFKSLDRTPEDGSVYYLAGTNKTKFKKAVFPGDKLQWAVSIVRLRNRCMIAGGPATVTCESVCTTMLTCAAEELG